MTQSSQPADHEQDLPLMHGKSGPIAITAAILGVAGVALAYITLTGSVRDVGAGHPPSLLAVNLGMCGIFLGIGALYRERGMTGRGLTRSLAVVGLVLGLAAPVVYAMQSLHWRVAMEQVELSHIQRIVDVSRTYARDHAGAFPPELETLAKDGQLSPETLQSPFSAVPDYVYTGQGLTLPMLAGAGDQAAALMLVHGSDLRFNMGAVGFADGHAAYLQAEDLDRALEADAAVRKKLGLKPAATAPANPAEAP